MGVAIPREQEHLTLDWVFNIVVLAVAHQIDENSVILVNRNSDDMEVIRQFVCLIDEIFEFLDFLRNGAILRKHEQCHLLEKVFEPFQGVDAFCENKRDVIRVWTF